MATERERADVRERRREWIEKRQPRMRLQPARLVFIDETAVNTKMTRLRGRSRRGERLRAAAPFGRWGKPDDIGGAAVFLCSEAASFITGTILPVDGGYMVK